MLKMAAVLLLSTLCFAQDKTAPAAASKPEAPAKQDAGKPLVIPAGAKIPVALQHAISSKNAREGDPVYAQTTFPFVVNDHILVPAGTYVQGKIGRVARAGRVKGRAEMMLHFTTLVFSNGYTLMMPGAMDNVPGSETVNMKDQEGTMQRDAEKGKDAEKVATAAGKGAAGGALAGALGSRSSGGTLIGAGAGAALGAAIALFSRGNDVRLEAGETVEMVIQRDITLDPNRLPVAPK
ncbi:MAG TPA: hypothetical protein VGF06_17685 [Terriglobales bacterium]|jgi:type IV secretion system protein VirB10